MTAIGSVKLLQPSEICSYTTESSIIKSTVMSPAYNEMTSSPSTQRIGSLDVNNGPRRGAGDPNSNCSTVARRQRSFPGSRLQTTRTCYGPETMTSSVSPVRYVDNSERVNNNSGDGGVVNENDVVDRSRRHRANIDDMLQMYFPVTLRASNGSPVNSYSQHSAGSTSSPRRRVKNSGSSDEDCGLCLSESTTGHRHRHESNLQHQQRTLHKQQRLRSAGSRQSSTRSSSSSTSNGSLDGIYWAGLVDARLGSPPPALQSSVNEEQLVQLRLRLLRIEEERHLEGRRNVDLELSRGPLPYWYEMRTSDFHREAHKNNKQLRHGTNDSSSRLTRTSSTISAAAIDGEAISPVATLTPSTAAAWAAAVAKYGRNWDNASSCQHRNSTSSLQQQTAAATAATSAVKPTTS